MTKLHRDDTNRKIPQVSNEVELNTYLKSQGLTLVYTSSDKIWKGIKVFGKDDYTKYLCSLKRLFNDYPRGSYEHNKLPFTVDTHRNIYSDGSQTDSLEVIFQTIIDLTGHERDRIDPPNLLVKTERPIGIFKVQDKEWMKDVEPTEQDFKALQRITMKDKEHVRKFKSKRQSNKIKMSSHKGQ